MAKRPYDLPPMSALVAYEAAARRVSFKEAARELNVTPAAISQHVKGLEAELGVPLFHRHHRGVELTETGAYLLVALQRGFETMGDAVDQLRHRAARAAITIQVTTAVSSLWLTPKLAQFWKTHGDISVAQIVMDTGEEAKDCDLIVGYGYPDPNDPRSSVLFRDQIMALGSPEFATSRQIKTIADLAKSPLIHFEAPLTNWTDWASWFKTLGHTGPINSRHQVNNYMIALQAARDDMGAVLGWVSLVKPHIDTGDLVPLLPDTVTPMEDFYIKLHPNARPRAQLVYDWLVSKV